MFYSHILYIYMNIYIYLDKYLLLLCKCDLGRLHYLHSTLFSLQCSFAHYFILAHFSFHSLISNYIQLCYYIVIGPLGLALVSMVRPPSSVSIFVLPIIAHQSDSLPSCAIKM